MRHHQHPAGYAFYRNVIAVPAAPPGVLPYIFGAGLCFGFRRSAALKISDPTAAALESISAEAISTEKENK